METRVGKAIVALQKYPEKIQIGRDPGFTLYAKLDGIRAPHGEAPVSAHRGIMQTGRILPVKSEQIQSVQNAKIKSIGGAFAEKDIFADFRGIPNQVFGANLDASSLVEFYNSVKARQDTNELKLSDIILFAVSRTLTEFPSMNAHYIENDAVSVADVNLGFGCDTDKGLLIPVIYKANSLSVLALSKAVRRLTEEARGFRISPEKLEGGSFTVLDFSAYGVNLTPALMPPQVGILNVNTMETKVKDLNGTLKAYPSLSLSLCVDSRAVDSLMAARFLSALCKNLENLVMLILK